MLRPVHVCCVLLCMARLALGATPESVKLLTDFETSNPFEGGKIVQEHAAEGGRALRIDKDYAGWAGPQDWTGYDYLKADVFTDARVPLPVTIEIRDRQTTGYSTRVNYQTIIPPGKSTIVVPLDQLYMGDKSRPGRRLMLDAITKFYFAIGEKPLAPLFIDNIRLERDVEFSKAFFEGLRAFDLGPDTGPVMPGFTRIDPATSYFKERGYGLLPGTRIWRAVDALQPDPLYQDFLCIERGGIAVDVPNGKYHVFINLDGPSGYWGDYQTYLHRLVMAQGKVVIEDTMNFDTFRQNYFRFWNTEDLPTDNTFEKYQASRFHEKQFDVEVNDGQLKIEFRGDNWACSVSAVIIYPAEKAEQGKQFLEAVREKKRFFFENYFHRVLHQATGDPLMPNPAQKQDGYVTFVRDIMEDVYCNDTPVKSEIGSAINGFGFAGEFQTLSVAVLPLHDLGKTSVTISDLTGPGVLRATDISVAYVSYRLMRVSGNGAIYTLAPRIVMPFNAVDCPANITRRWWIDVCPPGDAKPGIYQGQVTITPTHGRPSTLPVEYRVYPGTLDAADIPIGPWGHTVPMPWNFPDSAATDWKKRAEERSLIKLRNSGFTTCTGLPVLVYQGFKNGRPQFDFTEADRLMALARRCGFNMPVVSYCQIEGLDLYKRDQAAMKVAKFENYAQFVKAMFGAIQTHADAAHWLPVIWNIGDEPMGDDLIAALDNVEEYRAAFPKGPPQFTAATSIATTQPNGPEFRFAKTLHIANLNEFTEQSVQILQKSDGEWAFYNDGSRWTFGIYAYKAAKQFNMRFRLGWHFNISAGDPYYALDCREDDYAWCTAMPDGKLMSTIIFERDMRTGLNDYRLMLTLDHLARLKNDAAGLALINDRLNAFTLDQRDHDAVFPVVDWSEYRKKLADAVARLRS